VVYACMAQISRSTNTLTLFVWLVSQSASSIFFHTKSASATSQPTIFFFDNKSTPATNYQTQNIARHQPPIMLLFTTTGSSMDKNTSAANLLN